MASSSNVSVDAIRASTSPPRRKPLPSLNPNMISDYHRTENDNSSRSPSPSSRISARSSTHLLRNASSHPPSPVSSIHAPHIQEELHPNCTQFKRRRQFIKLFATGLTRFLITAALIAGLAGTFLEYEGYGVTGESGKRLFNTLVTGLSMALGISVASGLKNVALDIRWWVLSRKKRSIEEVDSILACSSLTEVSLLAARSARKMNPGLLLSCTLWVLLNIAAQTAVAMLGLTYSMNAGVNPAKRTAGQVSFSNMTQSWGKSVDEDTTPSSQLAAHTYGESALEFNPTNSTIIDPNTLYLSSYNTPTYFEAPSYFQYVFEEKSVDTTHPSQSWFFSNRSITVTSKCDVYDVIDNLNGSSQSFTFTDDGKVSTQQFSNIGPNSTTYLTSPDLYDCGPRCANVCGYENNGTAGFYYECEITISNVTNATIPEHRVSDENAKIAAGAIALQGYQTMNGSSQYQRFPEQSTYGRFLHGDRDEMAYNMRLFAIGVFTTADQIISDINTSKAFVSGFLPLQGVKLKIDHPGNMWALLGCIGGTQLVLFVLGLWVANRVVVVEDSYLAISLLMRPLAEGMKDKGCLLDKEERERRVKGEEVVYGMVSGEKGGVRGLEISGIAECERNSKRWEGSYDT